MQHSCAASCEVCGPRTTLKLLSIFLAIIKKKATWFVFIKLEAQQLSGGKFEGAEFTRYQRPLHLPSHKLPKCCKNSTKEQNSTLQGTSLKDEMAKLSTGKINHKLKISPLSNL
jgi:hypothetical protein